MKGVGVSSIAPQGVSAASCAAAAAARLPVGVVAFDLLQLERVLIALQAMLASNRGCLSMCPLWAVPVRIQ
jgi:hypothetical protein